MFCVKPSQFLFTRADVGARLQRRETDGTSLRCRLITLNRERRRVAPLVRRQI